MLFLKGDRVMSRVKFFLFSIFIFIYSASLFANTSILHNQKLVQAKNYFSQIEKVLDLYLNEVLNEEIYHIFTTEKEMEDLNYSLDNKIKELKLHEMQIDKIQKDLLLLKKEHLTLNLIENQNNSKKILASQLLQREQDKNYSFNVDNENGEKESLLSKIAFLQEKITKTFDDISQNAYEVDNYDKTIILLEKKKELMNKSLDTMNNIIETNKKAMQYSLQENLIGYLVSQSNKNILTEKQTKSKIKETLINDKNFSKFRNILGNEKFNNLTSAISDTLFHSLRRQNTYSYNVVFTGTGSFSDKSKDRVKPAVLAEGYFYNGRLNSVFNIYLGTDLTDSRKSYDSYENVLLSEKSAFFLGASIKKKISNNYAFYLESVFHNKEILSLENQMSKKIDLLTYSFGAEYLLFNEKCEFFCGYNVSNVIKNKTAFFDFADINNEKEFLDFWEIGLKAKITGNIFADFKFIVLDNDWQSILHKNNAILPFLRIGYVLPIR